MTAKKLTAEELAVKMEMGNHDWADDAAEMLRNQQAKIEALKKELALQRLSDIGQAIEKPVGSNWWKGDPTCGGIAENYMSKETSDKC